MFRADARKPSRGSNKTLGFMSIKSEQKETRICDCGCKQSYPVFSGLMSYGKESLVAYSVAHLQHRGDPHVWLLIGSGPWFENDARGCWVVLHTWIADDKLITRIEDPENSPFGEADVFEER